MKKIIVFGASNSKTSINKQLATYAGSLLKGVTISVLDFNDYELPLYSADVESEKGIHPIATKFSEELESADGYIISLAEHNGSYTSVFKNAYDWASRVQKKVWGNKPTLLLSTSPGERGGATVLETAKASFPYMGANVVGSLAFPSFYDNFKEGKIINEDLKNTLISKVILLQNAL